MSISLSNETYDILDTIEEILKDWNLYKLIIQEKRYPDIERYKQRAHIMKCVEERRDFLSKKECIYVELKYFKGKNYDEIAKSLRISPRSVANWRIRILHKIAKRGALL